MKYRTAKICLSVVTVVSTLMIASGAAQASSIHRGGAVTVALSGTDDAWANLDPAALSPNLPVMFSIYGALFEQGPHATVIPDLATGYAFSNHNLTVTITLRSGVKFQDGTPFNAAAVVANFQRLLNPTTACPCYGDFTLVTSVTAKGNYKVVLQLSKPDAVIIEAMVLDGVTWVPSPTALASEGLATFIQHPVAAGPFQVVSNVASSELVLSRFGGYWQKGKPYLSSLTFQAAVVDQSGYAALEAGTAQISEGISTPSIFAQAQGQYNVFKGPVTTARDVEFNTKVPPFNNILAREAIYYATNPKQIIASLFPGFATPTESPTGSGDLFYEPKVPGFRTYNPTKARALVQEVGGITSSLVCGPQYLINCEALTNQWAAVGINISIHDETTAAETAQVSSGAWQIFEAGAGAVDPDQGSADLAARTGCSGQLSGICDPTLEGLINQSYEFIGTAERSRVAAEIFKYLSDKAYVMYYLARPDVTMSDKNIGGIPGSTYPKPYTYFENVYMK